MEKIFALQLKQVTSTCGCTSRDSQKNQPILCLERWPPAVPSHHAPINPKIAVVWLSAAELQLPSVPITYLR